MAKTGKQSKDYRHSDAKAVLRPEAGAQEVFPKGKRKPPKTYRYDSSIAPEISWDQSEARRQGEQLIEDILQADDLEQAQSAAHKLRNLSAPFLNWSGKAERGEFTVPSLPLFVHERLSTKAILKTLEQHKRDRQLALEMFGEGQKTIGEAIAGAYTHLNGWQNRLILGDSLQVMNSLLQYEQIGGKVQMIYMDPPYGIKFGSNFMPFVRQHEVKDGDDKDLTREPEMVQAYRDTWELGIHSWLTYMRERLLVARDMLTDSGSCFVQISDDNVHLVRSVMDEVFGRENFVSLITYGTGTTSSSKNLATSGDYIVWYTKNKERMKYNQLFVQKEYGKGTWFDRIIKANGEDRKMGEQEIIEKGDKPYCFSKLTAAGYSPSLMYDFEFEGQIFKPRQRGWRTNREGMERLRATGRLGTPGKTLRYVHYWHDFPFNKMSNFWVDTAGAKLKQYVVQTSQKIIQRCMLMTTKPGDLVFDPTCGSGTTAVVAEQWGRRWITADVSRVPLALARQRLLTATYDYYKLKDEQRGPAGGFVYTRKQNQRGEEVGGIVPHITLKSVANNEPLAEEVLVDKPEKDTKLVRISGPFSVDAIMPTPLSPEDSFYSTPPPDSSSKYADTDYNNHITRMIEALKQSSQLRLSGNNTIQLKNIHPPARSMNLHTEAEIDEKPVAIMFGAADAAVSELAVIEAAKEAHRKDFARLLVIGFAIEPSARQSIQTMENIAAIPALYVEATPDIIMGDLLKNTKSSQLFAVCGLPEIRLHTAPEPGKDGDTLYQVQLLGLDVFDPNQETEEDQLLTRSGKDVPCWMLDPDYDGQVFRAGQIFFPRTNAWSKIKKAIKADFAETVWEHLASDTSAPFPAGENKQIAVKVIDDRGNELIKVKSIKETE